MLLVSTRAQAEIVRQLDALPVLDDPTFRMEWSFEERSSRFAAMLHEHVDPRLNGGDWVLVTIATQLETHALARWLQELPREQKPWVIVLFPSDRWNRSAGAEYDRQMAEFREVRSAIAGLPAEDCNRILFFTVPDPLAAELSTLLGAPVKVAPIPLEPGRMRWRDRFFRKRSPVQVAILGGARREKGSHLIPDIVRACPNVEFLVQLSNDTLSPAEFEELSRVADEPRVSAILGATTPREYWSALSKADIVLFPYEVIPYRQRPSGVFGEAAAFGKVVIATAGTWMAEHIEAGRAAGVIAQDLRPDSFANAVAQCVADIDRLRSSARALSTEWRRKVSLSAFVDLIEAEVALRSRAQPH